MEVEIKPHFIDRRWVVRMLEIFPGAVTWLFLLLPILLSIIKPIAVVYFIIAFDLFWLVKSFRMSLFLIRGYGRLHRAQKVDWQKRLDELEDLDKAIGRVESKIFNLIDADSNVTNSIQFSRKGSMAHQQYAALDHRLRTLQELSTRTSAIIPPHELYNVVILATYNESREILEPSIQALVKVKYPLKQIMLVIAYEERGGSAIEKTVKDLIKEYGDNFAYALAIKHPDGVPGEVKGKGPNISFAGRQVAQYLSEQNIDPEKVIVTTFDSDHRPSPYYFSYLSYVYAINPNRTRKSYQPIPMFYNNIWDAPAPMRVIATGNSFWMLMETMRPHRLRNFAAHAQSLRTLIDTDYWSITSIVEDGHQFWRTYFTYDGDHEVVPIFVPVYQDAVLADTYRQTFIEQYYQLRRWAWGVSDIPFVIRNSVKNKRIHWLDKGVHLFRLFEGHFSWATAPLILSFVAWLPLFLNQRFGDQLLAHQLPIITSRILTLAMLGLVITVLISLISLPPKPARYKRTRFLSMLTQWILLPVTGIFFSAFAALDAQTRLMTGRYLDYFRVTVKAVKK